MVYNMFHWHICCYVPRRIYNAYNLLILFQAFLLEIQTCVSYAYLFFQLFPPELSSLPRSDCSLICSIVLSDSPAVLANEYNTIRTIIINAMLNPIITLSSFKLVPYRQKLNLKVIQSTWLCLMLKHVGMRFILFAPHTKELQTSCCAFHDALLFPATLSPLTCLPRIRTISSPSMGYYPYGMSVIPFIILVSCSSFFISRYIKLLI